MTSASQGRCRRNEQKETESIGGGGGGDEESFGKMNSKRGEVITLLSSVKTVELNYPKRYPFGKREAFIGSMGISPLPDIIVSFVSVVRFSISLSILLTIAHEDSHGGPPESHTLSLLLLCYAMNTQDGASPFWLR